LAGVAPLVCAGITTYAPYKDHGLDKPGNKIGVVGLGGLGHMAVKFGVAFGCEVGAGWSGRHCRRPIQITWCMYCAC
jgi:D-arabinose 1-dehydrogenase-like Zn-dependent alcohol dehydrogenase